MGTVKGGSVQRAKGTKEYTPQIKMVKFTRTPFCLKLGCET
jgi:hypothetical protein